MLKCNREFLIKEQDFKTKPGDVPPGTIAQSIKAQTEPLLVFNNSNWLLCDTVFHALLQHTHIREIRFPQNIDGQPLEALCALMKDNGVILKIHVDKTKLPEELTKCLALNDNIATVDFATLIDNSKASIIIEEPRLLLYERFCQALIAHPLAAKVEVTDMLTPFQLGRLNRVLANNNRIVSVTINGIDATTTTADVEKLMHGHRPNGVRVLELHNSDKDILKEISADGALAELRIRQVYKDGKYSPLQSFLQTNFSVLEITCYGDNYELNQHLSVRSKWQGPSWLSDALQFNHYCESLLPVENIRNLTMKALSISDARAIFLAQRVELCVNMRHFQLTDLKISEPALFWIVSAIAKTQTRFLQSLTISGIQLSPRIHSLLIDIIQQSPRITELQLVNVNLSDADIPALAALLKTNVPLTIVNLHGNKIGNQGINILCEALETNCHVGALWLGGNPFDTTALPAITRLLAQSAFITSVSLQSSCMLENHVKSFIDEVKKTNTSVTELNISHHTVRNEYKKGGYNGELVVTAYKKNIMDLIEKFVTQNAQKRDKLFTHVRRGEIAQMEKIFDVKVSPLSTDSNGDTALHVAMAQDPINMPLIECLMRRGSHPMLMNKKGVMAINILREDSSPELRQLLLTPQQNFGANRGAAAEEPSSKKLKSAPEPKANVNTIDKFFSGPKRAQQPAPNDSGKAEGASPQSKIAKVAQEPLEQQEAPVIGNLADLPSIPHSAYFAVLNKDTMLLRNCLARMSPLHVYQDGNTLWHLAASKSALDCLHLLYSNLPLARASNLFLQLPLHLVCLNIDSSDSIEVMKLLIPANIDAINAADVFGQPPLYCLTGGFHQVHNVNLFDRYCAEAAKILLEHHADPNISVDDFNTQRKAVSTLQKAIVRGLYRLAKVLIASPRCNLSQTDAESWTALHYAVHFGQLALLARLLIQPQVNLNITNREGKTARQMLRDGQFSATVQNRQGLKEQMEMLFETRSRQRLPSLASEVHWVKSLILHYGNRHGRNHQLELSFNEDHALLQKDVRPHLQKPGNLLTASLTFIVSKGAHQPGANLPRIAIKINMTFTPKFHATDGWRSAALIENPDTVSTYKNFKRSPDALERIVARFNAAPDDIKNAAADNVNQDVKPVTVAAIRSLFNSTDDAASDHGFEQRFHHSEQALFDHLQQPEIVQHILQRLREDRQFVPGCKIFAVVLNAFSKNYLCPDCMVSTMGFQNTHDGEFFSLLKSQVLSMGCVLPKMSDLRAITLFSAQQPYHQARKSAEDHEEVVIDLRAHSNNKILIQDATAFQSSTTLFTSRKNV